VRVKVRESHQNPIISCLCAAARSFRNLKNTPQTTSQNSWKASISAFVSPYSRATGLSSPSLLGMSTDCWARSRRGGKARGGRATSQGGRGRGMAAPIFRSGTMLRATHQTWSRGAPTCNPGWTGRRSASCTQEAQFQTVSASRARSVGFSSGQSAIPPTAVRFDPPLSMGVSGRSNTLVKADKKTNNFKLFLCLFIIIRNCSTWTRRQHNARSGGRPSR
jgi:hypothetical protein